MLKELEFPFDSSYLLKKKKSLRRLLLENENQNNTTCNKSSHFGKQIIGQSYKKAGVNQTTGSSLSNPASSDINVSVKEISGID